MVRIDLSQFKDTYPKEQLISCAKMLDEFHLVNVMADNLVLEADDDEGALDILNEASGIDFNYRTIN